jgi:TetR/AcrR family transcriptional regulator of autoinduction and epiphytic fitness
MVVADFLQFPWIAKEFAAVMDPQTERLARYLAHLTAMGLLNCRNPTLAAHQFMGMINELSLWPRMMGRKSLPIPAEEMIEETIRMFLQHYCRPKSKRRSDNRGA